MIAETPTNNGTSSVDLLSTEVIDTALTQIWVFVRDQAQVSRDEVREYLKQQGIGTPVYQKAFSKLLDGMKVLTEVSTESGSKAYRFKDAVRVCPTYSDFLALTTSTKEPAKPREKFEDWYELTGYFSLTSPATASCPVMGRQGVLEFLRTESGDVLLLARYFAAMLERAAGKPGAPEIGTARYRVEWEQQVLPSSLIVKRVKPVPPARPGQPGQGLTEVETLPVGTRIPFNAVLPESHISPVDFATLLVIAGRWVGFSPSAAHQGYGRYVPHIDQLSTET
jgi:hypothetical protein